MNLKLDLKINDFAKEKFQDNMIEEPVSPPACEADEGPPLIFSQSIEEIAREVVDENRMFNKVDKNDDSNSNIPKVVELIERSPFPSMIPATVSDISEDSTPYSSKQPSTLHMSGGMVSTDMTLHMSSVPTSVITTNTNTNTVIEEDEGIDKILQYLMCKPPSQKEDDSQRIVPLDLSVAKVPAGSTLLPRTVINGEYKLENRKRKRDETPCEKADICITKKPIKASKKEVEGSNLKMFERGKSLKYDSKIEKGKEETTAKQFVINPRFGDSDVKNKKEKENIDFSPENPELENLKLGNNFNCKLLLPRKAEQKAKIVFPNGLYVEIDREVFDTLEQNVLKKTPECHKTVKKTTPQPKYEKKRTTQKNAKKQNSIQQSSKKKSFIDKSLKSTSNVPTCDIKPKDMPMIVIDENINIDKNKDMKGPNQVQINENNMTPPPSPPPSMTTNMFLPKSTLLNSPALSPNSMSPEPSPPLPSYSFSSPPPSNPSSPPGVHKLPSIVSKPSYYAKSESRKMLKVK